MKKQGLILVLMLMTIILITFGNSEVYAACSACDVGTAASCRNCTKGSWGTSGSMHNLECCCGRVYIRSHSASWGTYTVTKEATCSASGSKEATCTKCTLKTTSTINALSHDNYNKYVSTGSYGHMIYVTCRNCGHVSSTSSGPVAHSGGTATCTSGGSCTYCDEVYLSKLGHTGGSWKSEGYGTSKRHYKTCTRTGCGTNYNYGYHSYSTEYGSGDNCYRYTCNGCSGTSHSSWYGHTGGTATCIEKALCSKCNERYGSINASNHASTQTTTTHPQNDDSTHYEVVTHNCCGAEKSRTTKAHSWNTNHKCTICNYQGTHSWSGWTVTTAETCSAKGSEKRTCGCGALQTQDRAIDPNKHNYTIKCDKCGTTNVICSYNNAHIKSHLCDTVAPTVTVSNITYTQDATIKLKDTQSGIRYWGVTKNTTAPGSTGSADTTKGNTLAVWYPIANTTSEVSVTFSGLPAGTYYAWGKDLAGNSQRVEFKVSKLSLTIPTQKGTLTYNGKAQSPSWNDKNDTYMTLGGTTSKTNAGTYNATFTLKDSANTQWANGQITAQTAPWTIKKATPGAITLNPTSLTFTYTDAAKTVGVTRSGDGKVSAKSSKTTVATVSVSGTTITVTPIVVGESTITVSVAEGTNYLAATDVTFNVKVNKLSLTVPTQKGTLTYNGKAQSPSWNDKNDTYMTLGGTTSKTNAGTYNATFTLKDTANTQWANGQITPQTVPWTIKKATPEAITLNPTSLTFTYTDAAKTVAVTRTGDGKVSAKSSKTTVATVSVSGTTITVTPGVVGESTITVSVAEGTNYLAATDVTFNVKVNKLSLTIPTQSGNIVYDGNKHSPTWKDKNDAYMTLGGTTSATNAGTYNATFTLRDTANTQWSDKKIEVKTVQWKIDRKPISIPVVTNKIYNYATQTALASGTGYTRSGTYEAKNVGKYNTTATLDSNHIWSDNTTEPKTYTWSMLDVVMGTIKGPDAVQKKEKETATFKVEETQGTNKKYQWYYNTSNSTTGGTKINNATSAEYSVVVDRTMNNRYYYCIISNNSESATEATYKPSGTALLTVWWTHEISSHPKDVNVKKGETATFKVVAIDGNPSTYTYQWYSVASATGGTPTKLNGETSDTYSYKPTQNISGMWYYCETSNGQYLVTSNRAKLVADITVPTINAGVPSVTHANKNVTFTIPIKVSDTGEGFNTNSFVASDIIVKVDGTNVSPTVKTLEYKNQSGNDYNYVLTLKGITGDGLLTLDVDAGTIADNFGNINDDTSMLISGITIDNISPVISSNGEVTGTNQGYINSEDTIAVPVKIIDVGGMNPSEFTASDIVVLVGGVPDPNAQVTVSYSGKTGSEYAYVITITNINGNGEMMLEIDKEKVYDYATNSNIKTTISGLNVIIDNIKPVVNDIVLSLDGYENSSKLYPESLPSYNESWINEEVYSVIKSSDESSGVETYWHSVGDESNFSAIPTDREIWSDEMDERDKVFYRVIDRAGNISDSVGVIIKIDKTGPIAADLDMRQNRENGIIYEYEVDNPTSKTIFIKPKNTVDTGVYQSGVLKSEYIVTFNNGVTTTTSEVIDGNTGTLLKETGTYIIEIITTDKAGNTSNKFINAAIDKQTENTIKINNIHDDGSGVTKVTITARKQGASTDAIEPIIIENPGSNITQRIKLSDGTFVITVKIEDGVGLVKELQQTITNEL